MVAFRKKQIHIVIAVALITLVVILLYPDSNKLLLAVRGQTNSSRESAHIYPYSLPKTLTIEDTSAMSPAEAVPILMYHGVIARGEDIGPNTDRETFVSQMEMLKQKGYETISVKEYDLFREGRFTLPAKPIIITFDDGRKDSFYTVDQILEELGFKATLFVATTKANENDAFYLSWEELARVQATDRWELEAHGQRSHDKVVIDENGTLGRYYTSRIYTPGKGLESTEDYKERVEADYLNGIADIKEHLGIDAHYFAVPLSNYGILENFNYANAYTFNQKLTKRFFRLSFLEVESFESFYNYKDSDPHKLIRLEVQNIGTDKLLNFLERFAPKPVGLSLTTDTSKEMLLRNVQLLYGALETSNGITLLSSTSTPSARAVLGYRGWENYSIKATLVRTKGRSASVLIYYRDEYNFISLNWGENSLWLEEHIDGKDNELISFYPVKTRSGGVEVAMRIYKGILSASFDGRVLTSGIPVTLTHGAAGFGVWGPEGAESAIKNFEIQALTAEPLPLVSVITTDTTMITSNTPIATGAALNTPVAETVLNLEVGIKTETPEIPHVAVETVSLAEKTLPYLSNGFNSDDWEGAWGEFSIADGILDIGANTSTTGGGVLLNGSNSWKDYVWETRIDWLKSGTFSLLSRYQDFNNYLACSYTRYGGGVSLVQVIDGKATALAENYSLPVPFESPWLNINFAMKVKDNHVECLINGEWVLRFDVNAPPQIGGIGFETWARERNNIQIRIKDILVTSL